jgi:DnaJ-class molecular chaperone
MDFRTDLRLNRNSEKVPEQHCPACDGRGVPAAKQPARPGRRIFPAPCKKCRGKGRIAVTD